MSVESHKNPQGEGTSEARNQRRELSHTMDFEQKLKEIEKKILSVEGVEYDLKTLAKAGADKKQIARLLALAALGDDESWRLEVKRKQNQLKSVARRLDSVSEAYEELRTDPFCGPHIWLALLGMMKWEDVQGPAEKGSKSLLQSMMQRAAAAARSQASSLGQILRQGAPHSRRSPIVALCYYIRTSTGRHHDDVVVRLLIDAHEAVPAPKAFSADQIKKLRQRYMPPDIPE